MKKLLIGALLLYLAGSCSVSNSNQEDRADMNKKDKEQIELLLLTYKEALNTSNANLAMSLYAQDGIFMPSQAPSASGHDQILKSYQFIFSQIQLNIDFFIDEISIDSNVAFATTSSKGSSLIKASDQNVAESNRELFVFVKEEGKWKIGRYMFNKSSTNN